MQAKVCKREVILALEQHRWGSWGKVPLSYMGLAISQQRFSSNLIANIDLLSTKKPMHSCLTLKKNSTSQSRASLSLTLDGLFKFTHNFDIKWCLPPVNDKWSYHQSCAIAKILINKSIEFFLNSTKSLKNIIQSHLFLFDQIQVEWLSLWF